MNIHEALMNMQNEHWPGACWWVDDCVGAMAVAYARRTVHLLCGCAFCIRDSHSHP